LVDFRRWQAALVPTLVGGRDNAFLSNWYIGFRRQVATSNNYLMPASVFDHTQYGLGVSGSQCCGAADWEMTSRGSVIVGCWMGLRAPRAEAMAAADAVLDLGEAIGTIEQLLDADDLGPHQESRDGTS
jgi:hypothetical protein